MSESIMKMMTEYQASLKNYEEEQQDDSDEEELKLMVEEY